MKKVIAALIIAVMVVSISACSNKYKKTIPPDNSSVKEDVKEPSSETNTSDAQVDDKDLETKKNDTTTGDSNVIEEKSEKPNEEVKEEAKIDNIPKGLSNEAISSWMPARNKEHKVPVLNSKYKNILDKYDGYFVGDTSSKVIYLTFDEGYEYKYTGKILDILKDNDVKANFFLVKSYIKSNPELVKRMVNEGHVIGNHTVSHPNMPNLLSQKGLDAVAKELNDTADYFKEVTGKDMPKFFRPPEGTWSEALLYVTKSMGYKTILWSMAHRDWEVNNQPGREASYKFVDDYYHNGAILLLHPQSQSNTEALDDIIKNLKSKGYTFAPLTDLK
jgi:peptidoglycan-N-acetylmuramic acid deacetylase